MEGQSRPPGGPESNVGDWQPPAPPGPPPPHGYPPPPEAPPAYATQTRWPEGTWAGHVLAGWWGRVGATLLDTIFVTLLLVVPLVAGVAIGAATSDAAAIPFFLAAAAVWLFYAPFLMRREGARNGQTWGKQIVGIRVVKEGMEPLTFGWAFLRELVIKTLLFGWIGGSIVLGWLLDVLWPLWDSENRALHDMLATTRVVQA